VLCLGALLMVAGCASAAAQAAGAPAAGGASGLTVTTVANPRPQLISGSETLIRVTLPSAADRAGLRVTDNSRDITSAFAAQPGGSLLGLATGLRPGTDVITAADGPDHASVRITDHPVTGPVFSGPQQEPFFCETTAFGLAAAKQPYCSAPTVVSYVYMDTSGQFEPLADPADHPANLAHATVDGRSVPYIVRVETGTIDRAVYQIAALYDGSAPSPLHQDTSWNGKLMYTFGGGCNAGYHQGNKTGGVLEDPMLSQGYAVASSTLNVLDQNCDIPLSAEAAMMVKEHFIDTYGPVQYTIGWGGSGGSIQQYDIADSYPGILNGIIPGYSFPDVLTTLTSTTSDCELLDHFFAGPGASFTAAQRQAVAGFEQYESCVSWDEVFGNRLTPTGSCNNLILNTDDAIPASAEWNAVTNPDGIKCDPFQQMANQLGINPATGFANTTLDNTGVQYGLQALNDHQITAAQFISLNKDIGGLDDLGQPAAARMSAPAKTLTAAYRDDLVNSASLGLPSTPVIDQRVDYDLDGYLWDAHTTQWSFATRARLEQAAGSAANQVIIENQPTAETDAASAYELQAMSQWLGNIQADHSGRSLAEKMASDKPAGLADGCYLSATDRITSPLTDPATGPCAAQYPVASSPRQVAGEPLASNVLKCQLRPVNFATYKATFTASQKAELRAIFPSGVCDYQLPGIGQVPSQGTWLSYGDGSAGTFGHAPAPTPIPEPASNQ
jgi:uncharacterized tannase-like protein DUF6351